MNSATSSLLGRIVTKSGGYTLSLLWFFASGVCHQWPAHCLHYDGKPLPLCARCSGTFLGIQLALLTLWICGEGRASLLPDRRTAALLAVGPIVWAVDGVNSTLGWLRGATLWYDTNNTIRLLTGMANGLAVGCLLYPVYHGVLWGQTEKRRVLENKWPLAIIGLMGFLVAAGMLWGKGAPYALWIFLTVGATAASLTLVNALLIVLLLQKEGLARQWVELLPYLAVGLIATLGETASLASVRYFLGA